ncbi:hypothetical protein NW759_006884 [Fusarium solani]|nr:hypothetical protein NW759_006884 [Fusarium solani]
MLSLMVLISHFLRVVALTLLAATFTNAETGIVVPWNITAGQTEELTIRTRIDASDHEARKRFNAYRVFLALEPPGWGAGPVCWLVWSVPLDTDRVNITIPADVAPDKTRIRISASLYKTGQSKVNGYSYSSRTTLLGANGTWSQRELDGWDSSDENRISCWAFGCTRRCHMKYYTGDKTRILSLEARGLDLQLSRRRCACWRRLQLLELLIWSYKAWLSFLYSPALVGV